MTCLRCGRMINLLEGFDASSGNPYKRMKEKEMDHNQ